MQHDHRVSTLRSAGQAVTLNLATSLLLVLSVSGYAYTFALQWFEVAILCVPLIAVGMLLSGFNPWSGLWLCLLAPGLGLFNQIRKADKRAAEMLEHAHPELPTTHKKESP